jgi:hypothetical protein
MFNQVLWIIKQAYGNKDLKVDISKPSNFKSTGRTFLHAGWMWKAWG